MGLAALKDEHQAVPLHLRFGDFTIVLEGADEQLARRVARYFRPFASQAARRAEAVLRVDGRRTGAPARAEFRPWDARGKESFAEVDSRRLVRKDRTGVLISIDGREWSIAGDLERHFSQLINLIGTMYGVWRLDQDCAMIHASAVVQNGRAVAIVGESGQGKSSVAVRLLEHGFDFLTNDRLILKARGRGIWTYGVPKLPRVNPGTLLAGTKTRSLIDAASRRRYDKLSKRDLWALEEKRDLDVQHSLGRRWLLDAPLAGAVVLGWRQGGQGLTLRRLQPDQAFEYLRPAAKTFGAFDCRLASRSDGALRDTAMRVPIYLATGKVDPTRLAREIAAGAL